MDTRSTIRIGILLASISFVAAQDATGTYPAVPLASKGPYIYPTGVVRLSRVISLTCPQSLSVGVYATQLTRISHAAIQSGHGCRTDPWDAARLQHLQLYHGEPAVALPDVMAERARWCVEFISIIYMLLGSWFTE